MTARGCDRRGLASKQAPQRRGATKMDKILLIEDDKDIQSINTFFLKSRGYEVRCAYSCEEGLHACRAFEPEVIVLDVNLPDGTGLELCPKLKAVTPCPIIFLSCMDTEDDKIAGLLTGGDDYMTKPYSVKELEARIRVCLRRSAPAQDKAAGRSVLRFGPLSIDMTSECALVGEERLNLPRKAFLILCYLARHPGECVSAQQIYEEVWGLKSMGDLRTVHVHMFNLRKYLDQAVPQHEFIQTAWGKGYCFVPADEQEQAAKTQG